MSEPILEVSGLCVAYGAREVVHRVDLTLARGAVLGVVGESGSGKSTLARALMGLVPVSAGRVVNRARGTQMVFQDAVGSLNPRFTVRRTLAEVLRVTRSRATPEALLERVGLSTAVLDQCPRELSGGQCQRVSVARALACAPEILIADEPVSALDVSVQARLLNLFRELRRDLGLSILLIAHDLAVVRNVCDEVAVMEKGAIVESGPADGLFGHPAHPYTRRLLEAVPRLEPVFQLKGNV